MSRSKKAPPSADAIALLGWAGVQWHRGAIPTALGMIEPYLRHAGAWQSPRMPDLIERIPSVWARDLDPAERALSWCHLIDKHAAYLGACSSLELGIDHPQRVDRPAFERSTPGYWRIEASRVPWPLRLPDPLGRDVPTLRRPDGQWWLTTPTIELAIEHDIDFEIREAWLWPRHRRLLRPFYERCRGARMALERVLSAGPPERRRKAAVAAVGALKASYAALLGGGLAAIKNRKRSPRPPWYRPDWRHAIIAKSRANLIRNQLYWAAHGVHVAAIYNDGCYVLSDQPGAPSSVNLDRSLGAYSLKASWPAASMIGRRGRVVPSLAWGEDDG